MPVFQVSNKHFCAGLKVNGRGVIVDAAPILGRYVGKRWDTVREYLQKRFLKIVRVDEVDLRSETTENLTSASHNRLRLRQTKETSDANALDGRDEPDENARERASSEEVRRAWSG